MKKSLRLPIIALLTGVAVAIMLVPPARSADCANPQGTGVERACAKATEGVPALRRFILRTQPIYNLSIYDFRAPDSNDSQVATRDRAKSAAKYPRMTALDRR